MRFPDEHDEKLAEFIGILLGDGSISNTYQNRIQITLNKKEVEYREHIINMIRELFNVEPRIVFRKGESTIDIQLFKRELIDFLIKNIGLKTAPKWKRAVIPRMYLKTALEKDILRGYFDTDGSVVLANNNGTLYPRLEMKISPSPMQRSFIEILKRTGIRFGAYDIGKGKIRIQINGIKEINKWMEQVGISNKKQSERLRGIAGAGISGVFTPFEPATFPQGTTQTEPFKVSQKPMSHSP